MLTERAMSWRKSSLPTRNLLYLASCGNFAETKSLALFIRYKIVSLSKTTAICRYSAPAPLVRSTNSRLPCLENKHTRRQVPPSVVSYLLQYVCTTPYLDDGPDTSLPSTSHPASAISHSIGSISNYQ